MTQVAGSVITNGNMAGKRDVYYKGVNEQGNKVTAYTDGAYRLEFMITNEFSYTYAQVVKGILPCRWAQVDKFLFNCAQIFVRNSIRFLW